MSPNRVAALGAAATAIGTGIAAALGAIDSTPKAVVASVGLVVVGAVTVVYLLGWQKHEARQPLSSTYSASNAAALIREAANTNTTETPTDGYYDLAKHDPALYRLAANRLTTNAGAVPAEDVLGDLSDSGWRLGDPPTNEDVAWGKSVMADLRDDTLADNDEPGDHFDGLPHHPVKDPGKIPVDKGDAGAPA